MRNKKLISRVLASTLALMLTFTFTPSNLIASALGGVGTGQSGNGEGGGTVGDNDCLLNEDIGLRFSLVTLNDKGEKTVVETVSPGMYFIDVWCDEIALNLKDMYRVVTDNTRYATESDTGATHSTIIKATSSGVSNTINSWLKDTYGASNVTAGFNLGSVLFDSNVNGEAIFNEYEDSGHTKLSVYGKKFYDWAMAESNIKIKGEGVPNLEAFIKCFYSTKLNDLDLKQTFLTVEPIIYYADLNGTEATGTKSVASAYGYIAHQQSNGYDPGNAWAIHGRLAMVVNGFCFGDLPQDVDVITQINNVLGLRSPVKNSSKDDFYPTGSRFFDFGNCMDEVGLGIQAFWLEGLTSIDAPGTPIDTYDILDKPKDTPENSEPPSEEKDDSGKTTMDTNGSKTIIKMYVDLYKDPNTGYYTQIIDKDQFVRENVSNSITISDEEKINGYKVSAWYTSGAEYKDLPKGSSMLATKDIGIDDGAVKLSSLGGKQLKVNNYTTATGYAAVSGGKSYYGGLSSPHGVDGSGLNASCTSEDANPYTTYKRLEVSGESYYGDYNFPVNNDDKANYVTLGSDEKTLVILYTREMSYISTTDTSVTKDKDERKNNSGELTIVKLYGTINPSTYEIEDIKSTTLTGTTRNVNIHNESGYDFAEWIYVTSGEQTVKNASVMGDPDYCSFDGTVDQAYRLDGFVDGFKNNSSLKLGFQFNGNFPEIYTITGTDHLSEEEIVGRYSYGSRSGIGDNTYNSTIYFGGTENLADGQVDGSDSNDVLYLLFLKNDQLTYAADDLVIPQSYLTRYDNYKHNPMTVTGSISGDTHKEYLQEHKFKYVLPVIADAEYKELNPLFIPHIALKDKGQAGLIPTYSSVQRLQLNPGDTQHEVIKAYGDSFGLGMSDYAQLVYIDHGDLITSSSNKKAIGNILNVSALNLEYTAYRTGDQVTIASWKHDHINKMATAIGTGYKLLATDTGKPLGEINHIAELNSALPDILAYGVGVSGNKPETVRKQNDSTQNFKLDFSFTEVGDGVKRISLYTNKSGGQNLITNFQGIEQPTSVTIDGVTKNLFKSPDSFRSYRYNGSDTKVLSKAYCENLTGAYDKYEIHSLNRLYSIKTDPESDKWETAIGKTKYLDKASDVSITQNVQYGVHYGSSISNPYADDTKTGNGTDDRGQYGYVKSMKANNTISFYPYYVMQYELPSAYNSQLKKNGVKESESNITTYNLENNANQVYVLGEEKRYLNVYDYAEVSFYGHAVSSNYGTDVVNNVINTNRNGRIEISSEQWSTHARANSLIGLGNCALPGGATLSITIPSNNRQTVTITSYSAFLPNQSAGYAQVASQNDPSAFGNMSTNTADVSARHESLVASVVAGFEGLNVEQYFTNDTGYTNTNDHGSTYDSVNTVYNQIHKDLNPGKNLYDIPNVYKVTDFSNKEGKYYYRPDGDVNFVSGKAEVIKHNGYEFATGDEKDGQGNTGDFDTDYTEADSKPSATYYTFYMNRIGQVLCIKDNNLESSAMANVTGTTVGDNSVLVAEWTPTGFNYASGLDDDIRLTAQNTGIVDELYKQLQEGTGLDASTPWSTTDGQWYFEAFDGITIAKFETKLTVGFIDPYERTSVLDPAVIPDMQNKGDMLTSAIASQIVTSDTSLKYGIVNKIGEYCDIDGNKIGDIVMPDLRSFFISDIFFAPNITVQDLK